MRIRQVHKPLIHVLDEFSFVSAIKWHRLKQGLKNGNAKAPYVYSLIIKFIVEYLRSHVQWCPAIEFDIFSLFNRGRETEVT